MRTRHAFVFFASIVLFALIFSATARTEIVGSGKVVDQVRNVGPFSSVEVGAGIRVRIEGGPQSPLALRGEDNVLPIVRTEVKDGRLIIGFQSGNSVTTHSGVSIGIRVPRIDALATSGGAGIESSAPSGDKLALDASGGSEIHLSPAVHAREIDVSGSGGAKIDLDGVDAQVVRVDGSGATQVSLAGRAGEAKVNISGAASLRAAGFAVNALQISASGAAKAAVRAVGQVGGSVSGGSQLRVARSATVDVSVSGGSEVRRDVD